MIDCFTFDRPVGSLYANLQCHMMSCDILRRGQSSDGNHKPTCCQGDGAHCHGNSDGLAHSLVYLAMRFADEGRNGEAGQLLRYSQRAFAPNSKALQVSHNHFCNILSTNLPPRLPVRYYYVALGNWK